MAFDIAKFSQRKLPAIVKFGGENVKIEYKAGKEARAFEELVQEMQAMTPEEEAEHEDGGRMLLCEALCLILVGWEVQDDGKDVPINAKSLNELPMPTAFYNAISNKIGEELRNGGRGAGKA